MKTPTILPAPNDTSHDHCPNPGRMSLRGQCADCNALRPLFDAYTAKCNGHLKSAIKAIRKSGRPDLLLKSAQALPVAQRLSDEGNLPSCLKAEITAFRANIKTKARWLDRILADREKEDFWRHTVPSLYQETAIDILPFPDISRTVLGYGYEDTPSGVLLYGSTGTGKTRTAFLLLRDWLFVTPWSWSFRYLQGSEIADAANARSRAGTIGEWVAELVDGVDCIFIDDIGHGNFSNSYAEALRRLVEVCTSTGLPLVVTCQFDGRALVKQWSREEPGKAETAKAIVRRLSEFCRPVHFHARPAKATGMSP